MKQERSYQVKSVRDMAIIEARKDREGCQQNCYDFGFYFNKTTKGYFVRYTKSQLKGEHFDQNYRWICFNTEGVRVDCDPIFEAIEDENNFYGNMILIENFTI